VPRQLVRDLEPGRLRPDEDVVLRANSRIVVEAAHRYDRDPALAVNSRHGGPARPAERLREEPRFGELVGGAVVFTARERHAVGGGDEVCGMRGGASPPATAAVAVHGAQRLAFDDERDGPAETAAAHRAGRIERRPIGNRRSVETFGVRVEPRELVGDLEPRGLRSDEDVTDRTDARILCEIPGRHEDSSVERSFRRHHRPAVAAEATREPGRRLPANDVLQTAKPEAALRPAHIRRERGAVALAAPRAMAVAHQLERPFELP
jgi:hypothetical protein